MVAGAATARADLAPSAIREMIPEQQPVVLARALRREGYDDRHAGHITVRRGDELLALAGGVGWDEARPGDVIRIDGDGDTRRGTGSAPPGLWEWAVRRERRADPSPPVGADAGVTGGAP